MAESALAMKMLNERFLECSIYAVFFSSSLTVSINAIIEHYKFSTHRYIPNFQQNTYQPISNSR